MRDVFQQLLDNLQEMVRFSIKASYVFSPLLFTGTDTADSNAYGVSNAHIDKEWGEVNMTRRLYKRVCQAHIAIGKLIRGRSLTFSLMGI